MRTPGARFTCDRNLVLARRSWTPRAQELAGWTAEEVDGQPLRLIIPDDATLETLALELDTTGRWEGRLRIRTKAGEPLEVRAEFAANLNRGGGWDSYRAVLHPTKFRPQTATETSRSARHVSRNESRQLAPHGAESAAVTAADRRKILAFNIRYAREHAAGGGISQQQLADLLGVTRTRVADWEKREGARYTPNADHLEAIAAELGVTVGWLLDEHPELADDDDEEEHAA